MTDNPPARPVDANVVAAPAPAPKAAPKPKSAPESTVAADVWAYGNHDRQVPLAGALADDPSLRGASLTPADWRQRVDAYLSKPA